MYVYIQSEQGLWTVGHYNPQGKWIPESDWATPEQAAERVHYLNGGNKQTSARCAFNTSRANPQSMEVLQWTNRL